VCEIPDHRLPARLRFGEVAEARAATDKRVTAEASAFHRLEQKGRAALTAQADIRAEWRHEICADVGCDVHHEVSIEWTGTQKDLPAEGLVERNGMFWSRSMQAQAPA